MRDFFESIDTNRRRRRLTTLNKKRRRRRKKPLQKMCVPFVKVSGGGGGRDKFPIYSPSQFKATAGILRRLISKKGFLRTYVRMYASLVFSVRIDFQVRGNKKQRKMLRKDKELPRRSVCLSLYLCFLVQECGFEGVNVLVQYVRSKRFQVSYAHC